MRCVVEPSAGSTTATAASSSRARWSAPMTAPRIDESTNDAFVMSMTSGPPASSTPEKRPRTSEAVNTSCSPSSATTVAVPRLSTSTCGRSGAADEAPSL